MLIILTLWIACGIFSVTLATSKGRKEMLLLVLLILLGPVGLALVLLGKEPVRKYCPYCDAPVEVEEGSCSLCGLDLEGTEGSEETSVSRACPRCGGGDVHDAYLEDGSWGKWCPHCKMSIKRMRDK